MRVKLELNFSVQDYLMLETVWKHYNELMDRKSDMQMFYSVYFMKLLKNDPVYIQYRDGLNENLKKLGIEPIK